MGEAKGEVLLAFSNSASEDMTSDTERDTQPLLLLFEVGEAKSSKMTALSFSLSLSMMEVSVTSDEEFAGPALVVVAVACCLQIDLAV